MGLRHGEPDIHQNSVQCCMGRSPSARGKRYLPTAKRFSPMLSYALFFCKRPIKMSPAWQLEMTLPGGFPGVSRVTVRLMSGRKLSRLEVLRDLDQKQLTTEAATQLLGA
jgi:hypothetical protein